MVKQQAASLWVRARYAVLPVTLAGLLAYDGVPLAAARGEGAPVQLAQAAPQPAPPSIPVVRPTVQVVADTLELTGNAAAVNTVKVVARVNGLLEKQHVPDGALVRKGELLFTIQQELYKSQLQQAQAQVMAAQAALTYARTEVVRYTALVKKDAATQVDVDRWVYQRASAEAQLYGAQAQLAIAQLNLSYTDVRAPFDGQMGKHLVDPFNVVGGVGDQSALAEVVQLDPIYVTANISSQSALQIRANLDQRRITQADFAKVPIEAALADETGFPHKGVLEYVAPAVDASTGTLFLRGLLQNPNRTLLPGMFVKIRLPMGRTQQQALLVPNRAIGEDQGGRYLLTVDADNTVRQRYVQQGALVGELRVITSGITRDDRVVVGELWRATPGTRVNPVLQP